MARGADFVSFFSTPGSEFCTEKLSWAAILRGKISGLGGGGGGENGHQSK